MFVLSEFNNKTVITNTSIISLKNIDIPTDTRSNGASIPRLFWTILGYHPFSKPVYKAAFLHDYLISIHYNGPIRDYLFYSQLVLDGVPEWKAKLMWQGVVLWRVFKVKVLRKKF